MRSVFIVACTVVMFGCEGEQARQVRQEASAPPGMGGVWYVEGADSNGTNYVWRVDTIQRGDSVKALMLGMFGPEVSAKIGVFGRVRADGKFRYEGSSNSVRYCIEGTPNAERTDFTGRRLRWTVPAGPGDTLIIPVTGQKL